ncbi:hypothetical protein [Microseira wollei]|uniref:hypothetical protein n=1 Tax=Microseira wollei TaxID=467598 RepID=UPI001CFE7211|nr:hypothetical protein [Microseira wollei]
MPLPVGESIGGTTCRGTAPATIVLKTEKVYTAVPLPPPMLGMICLTNCKLTNKRINWWNNL